MIPPELWGGLGEDENGDPLHLNDTLGELHHILPKW